MQIIRKLDELNEFLAPVWADDNDLLAYVPTMGALHSGHVSLIHKAKEVAQKIIVSIFVNPLQFGPNEDLDSYPRSIDEDIIKLWAAEIAYLYIPELTEVELESLTKINAD